ncbi:MAG: cyclopropane-fatty-acyl-phospholipid synthase family protein [Gammaproteobacteria bacterium]
MKAGSLILNMFEQLQDSGLKQTINFWIRQQMQNKLQGLETGHIVIHDPWGSWSLGSESDPGVQITIHDPAFFTCVFKNGSNGAADAYRRGLWSCSSLKTLFQILLRNTAQLDAMEQGLAKLGVIKDRLFHKRRANTRNGSSQNIQDHYDIGNDLFELFLDETMTYSSAIFIDENTSLHDASLQKMDLICQKLDLKPEHHVVEIGSGWGSFSIHAAQHYGCKVTTTTISREQHDLARQRIDAAGLGDRIELLLTDYRDMQGQYDRLVSIEMIEAVGHDFLPEYFQQCASLLKDDGQMCIQAIAMPDNRYEAYLKTPDFIQRYIFPGSCCPSLAAMTQAIATTDLKVTHIEDYAPDYARTLQCWLKTFMEKEEQVYELGYSRSFFRMWEYYLEYCTAGFTERYLGLLQLVMNKPACRRELTNIKFQVKPT